IAEEADEADETHREEDGNGTAAAEDALQQQHSSRRWPPANGACHSQHSRTLFAPSALAIRVRLLFFTFTFRLHAVFTLPLAGHMDATCWSASTAFAFA